MPPAGYACQSFRPPRWPFPAGQELGRVEIPSHFTHDAVRRRNKVYVCNTAEGSILEYNFPDMRLVRSWLWTAGA